MFTILFDEYIRDHKDFMQEAKEDVAFTDKYKDLYDKFEKESKAIKSYKIL